MLTATTHHQVDISPNRTGPGYGASVAYWLLGAAASWSLLLASVWGIIQMLGG